jgi:hypothetical protein
MKISAESFLLAIGSTPFVRAFILLLPLRTSSSHYVAFSATATTRLFVSINPFKDQPMSSIDETRASVSKYYGQELTESNDLKTNACCTAGVLPMYIREAIENIHPEVIARYYGCGLCLPQYPLEGANILDLGSGSGRDVYIASQLVGKTGKVGCDEFGCTVIFCEVHKAIKIYIILLSIFLTFSTAGCWCRHD